MPWPRPAIFMGGAPSLPVDREFAGKRTRGGIASHPWRSRDPHHRLAGRGRRPRGRPSTACPQLKVNTRIEESTGQKVGVEWGIAVGVFWVIVLITLVAVFDSLHLPI